MQGYSPETAMKSDMRPRPRRVLAALLAPCILLLSAASGPSRVAAHSLGGTIRVIPSGPVRTVTPTLLGLNGVNLHGPLWDDGPLDAVLKKFAPGVLRYPGGTVANYWSWQNGWFQPGRWPGQPGRPVDDRLPVFASAVRAGGSVPMFVLNTVTYDGAVDQLRQTAPCWISSSNSSTPPWRRGSRSDWWNWGTSCT